MSTRTARLAAAGAAIVLTFVLLAVAFTYLGTGTSSKRFIEPATGRVCLEVISRSGVALDCDYPPADQRLANSLHNLT